MCIKQVHEEISKKDLKMVFGKYNKLRLFGNDNKGITFIKSREQINTIK